jgi:O-antigen/teichoic acid export membrane protein
MFYGLFYVGTVGINIFKKTYYQTIAIIVSSALNLILNYFLTSRYGILGASLSQLISFLLLGFLAVYFSQKIYHIPFEAKRIIQLCLISLLFLTILAFGVKGISIFSVMLKIAILFILFPLSLYYIRFFSKDENAFFKEIIFKLKNVSTK